MYPTEGFLSPYSPYCLDVEFCELRHDGVLGSSARKRRAEATVLPALPLLALIHERRGRMGILESSLRA